MNSQYEINLRHADALDAADRAFRLKTAVKDVAARHGLVATFMGKPFNDQGGSGSHFHISLADARATTRSTTPTAPTGSATMRATSSRACSSTAPALMAS